MRRIVTCLLLGLAPSALVAQPSVSLTKPDATFADPFTRIFSLRELPNGKVIVSDLQDKVVQLVDLAGGEAVKIGREGQGPGEYSFPGSLYPMPNGETWLNDLAARRFLVIGPDAKPGRSVSLPNSGGGVIGVMAGGGGADQQGRIYFQAPPFNAANPGAPAPDSMAILRWDGAKPTFDTVAYLVGPKGSISTSGGGGNQRVSIRIGGGKVFTPQEAWGVAADGSIARVTPNPYRVIWYPPARNAGVAGPVQAYTPLKVTDADKKEEVERRKRQRPMMVAIGGGGGVRAGAPSVQLPDPEFEETKPPFTGNNSVQVAPEGEVWVRRTQPAGAKNPLYDVFDKTGKLARTVTLNPNSAVVGFGKGTVYVARTDADDLQYLERYRR